MLLPGAWARDQRACSRRESAIIKSGRTVSINVMSEEMTEEFPNSAKEEKR